MVIVVPWKIVARPKVVMSTCSIKEQSQLQRIICFVVLGEEVGFFRVLFCLVWGFFCSLFWGFLGWDGVFLRVFCLVFFVVVLGGFVVVCVFVEVYWLQDLQGCRICLFGDFCVGLVWFLFGCMIWGLLFLVFPCLFCPVIFIY